MAAIINIQHPQPITFVHGITPPIVNYFPWSPMVFNATQSNAPLMLRPIILILDLELSIVNTVKYSFLQYADLQIPMFEVRMNTNAIRFIHWVFPVNL